MLAGLKCRLAVDGMVGVIIKETVKTKMQTQRESGVRRLGWRWAAIGCVRVSELAMEDPRLPLLIPFGQVVMQDGLGCAVGR